MRRRTVHTLFGGVAVVCAALTGYEVLRLTQAQRVNSALGHAAAPDTDLVMPEAQFAAAMELARSGNTDGALNAYKQLMQNARADHLRLAAQYNVGNLLMRAAAHTSTQDATQSLPLIELAKQSYRDVLRTNPQDWDARYNLELALRLAPEFDEEVLSDDDEEGAEQGAPSTVQRAKMDLP